MFGEPVDIGFPLASHVGDGAAQLGDGGGFLINGCADFFHAEFLAFDAAVVALQFGLVLFSDFAEGFCVAVVSGDRDSQGVDDPCELVEALAALFALRFGIRVEPS